MSRVTLIDYGAGNLLNVQRAFEYCGAKVDIASTPEEVLAADRLVFPGVGAFPEAMQQLKNKNLVEAIQETAQQQPFLGICLGMQMMLNQSEEFAITEGLKLLPGRVTGLPQVSVGGDLMTVPHMGWAKVSSTGKDWSQSVLADITEQNAFYFVHSFHAEMQYQEHQLAAFDFGGHLITAAVQKDNMMGCQFHPEKSGELGLKIIRSYLKI